MKKILKFAVAFSLLIGVFVFINIPKTSADSFNSSDIIDDGIFNNDQSMSAAQINGFLNSLPNSCISPNSGFDAIDPTGYSPSAGFTFGGWTTAGQVIYDAAQAYQINPQVLLATLQKEQSLVAGGAGICTGTSSQNQYAAAVGYGCPDSGSTYSYANVNLYERNGAMVTSTGPTCVDSAADAGFSQQIIRAAWLLKFGEERSEGNVSWAIINSSWDNSDDPQSCYSGPMTKGTFQICPGGTSTYYDGYTTIDGTSVYLDNGATAALYWYTPHLSGNENFSTIFTNWFGSTTYAQPLDSMFVTDPSGRAYFISLNSDTYYYIPTWSTVVAYGLNSYNAMPMSDAQIEAYTNGGTLTTLVWNNDDQKIYLVDHDTKYWFQQYCSEWGLDCLNQTPGDVTFMTSTYFDDIVGNGGNSQPIQQYNGTLYLMQNGQKDPIADTSTLLSQGYTGSDILPIDQGDLNSTQALGPLDITTPGFVEFPPSGELLYFDGAQYWYVQSYQMYEDWGSQNISVPATSSYNTTIPTTAGNLSDCVTDGSGNDYYINSGEKININADPSNWCSSFQTLSSGILSSFKTVTAENNINVNGAIYVLQNHTLRHVPSYNDYLWLGINGSNTITLSQGVYSDIPAGTDILADGTYFSVSGNDNLYVKNAVNSYNVTDAIANDYGINWSNIDSNLSSAVLSGAYPSTQSLSRWAEPSDGSNLSYIDNLTRYEVSSQVGYDWGISSSTVSPSPVDMALLANLPYTKNIGQFVENKSTGMVYYGSGGVYHYIASYNTFVALGGTMGNLVQVYPDFFTGLTQGSTLN